jgi:hypothetical protein
MSGATARKPRSAKQRSWCRQLCESSGPAVHEHDQRRFVGAARQIEARVAIGFREVFGDGKDHRSSSGVSTLGGASLPARGGKRFT